MEGLAENVETVSLPARSSAAGDVLDPAHPVQETVDRCAREDAVPIVHCVLGSKTGIYEPFPSTNFGDLPFQASPSPNRPHHSHHRIAPAPHATRRGRGFW